MGKIKDSIVDSWPCEASYRPLSLLLATDYETTDN